MDSNSRPFPLDDWRIRMPLARTRTDVRQSWTASKVNAFVSRFFRQTDLLIWRAGRSDSPPSMPVGTGFHRVTARSRPAERDRVEIAMRAAGEPKGLAAERFGHGDECCGWMVNGALVSFGWITRADRNIGPAELLDAPERLFLFNFHTTKQARGRGYYPALLLMLRYEFGREGFSEFIIDVNSRNAASISGIEKAGFRMVARVGFQVLLNCLYLLRSATSIDPAHRLLDLHGG